MKRTVLALALVAWGYGESAIAAPPDIETYIYVTRKYNLLIRETKDGCVFQTDPKFVVVTPNQPDIRRLIVLQSQGKKSGSACDGVFQFQFADVNCKTGQMQFTQGLGAPQTWKYESYSDSAIAKKICALPVMQYGVPNRRPTAK